MSSLAHGQDDPLVWALPSPPAPHPSSEGSWTDAGRLHAADSCIPAPGLALRRSRSHGGSKSSNGTRGLGAVALLRATSSSSLHRRPIPGLDLSKVHELAHLGDECADVVAPCSGQVAGWAAAVESAEVQMTVAARPAARGGSTQMSKNEFWSGVPKRRHTVGGDGDEITNLNRGDCGWLDSGGFGSTIRSAATVSQGCLRAAGSEQRLLAAQSDQRLPSRLSKEDTSCLSSAGAGDPFALGQARLPPVQRQRLGREGRCERVKGGAPTVTHVHTHIHHHYHVRVLHNLMTELESCSLGTPVPTGLSETPTKKKVFSRLFLEPVKP